MGLSRHGPPLLAALALGLLLASCGSAPRPQTTGSDASMTRQQPGAGDPAAAALLERAESRSQLPVILRLQPLGEGSERQRIRRAQEAVTARVPNAANVYLSETGPFVTMAVTAEELRRLLAAPEVLEILEDEAVPPTGGAGGLSGTAD